MKINKDLELRFLRNFKRAVSSFNMLDRNLAYCLWWSASNQGKQREIKALHDLTFDKKFKKVQTLITRCNRKSQYDEFIRSAEDCRKFRNRLIHGEWELKQCGDNNIRFHVFIPSEEQGVLTHDEFEGMVDLVETTNSQFCKLRERYPIETDQWTIKE